MLLYKAPCPASGLLSATRCFGSTGERAPWFWKAIGKPVPAELNTFVLCGMGGVGKTEIAIEYVFSHLSDYDAIFVFHADQASTLAEEYNQAAVQLGLEQTTTADGQESRELFKSWLAEPLKSQTLSHSASSLPDQNARYAKWLIVFDNADEPERLAEYWPTAGFGSVLVTSRNPMAKSSFFFGDIGYELGSLTHDNAAQWILKLSGSDTSKEVSDAAKLIAERLGGLPLAITQVSSIIRMRQLGLPEFIELYDNDIGLTDFSTRVGNNRGYKHSLASVWALGNLEVGPLTLLGVISQLDPDRIHEELLTQLPAETYGLDYPSTRREYHQNLTPLLQSSLIQRNSANAEVRVHRLVTDVVREQLQAVGIFRQTFFLTVDLVSTLWPSWWLENSKAGNFHNVERWVTSAKLYPHVLRLVQTLRGMEQQEETLSIFGKFADLLSEAAAYQYERSNFRELHRLLELVEKLYNAQDQDNNWKLAKAFELRSAGARLMNNGEAALLYGEESLRLQILDREKTKSDTMALSYAYFNVGLAYNLLKLPSKAISYMDKTMEIRKSLPGYQSIDLYGPLHQRGLSLLQQGDVNGCERAVLEAKAIWEAVKGTNDMGSFRAGSIFFTLGLVYERQGLMAESSQWYTRAMKHLIATVGDNHIHTARVCFAVAEHYMRRGELRDAKPLLDKTIWVYSMHPAYKEELAKAYFLSGRLAAGDPSRVATAATYLASAAQCLNDIHPHARYTGDTVREEHFYGLGSLGLT